MKVQGKEINIWVCGRSTKGQLGLTTLDAACPTLFFIHGLGSSHNFYYGIICELVKNANCILMDTEGAAATPLTHSMPSVDSVAADIISVMDSLALSRTVLVGHSMGGMIALRTAAQYHDRVVGVIAIGAVHPTPVVKSAIEKRVDLVKSCNSVVGIADAVSSNALGARAQPAHRAFVRALICQQTPEGYMANCKVIVNAPIPNYAKVDQPVALICGEDDKTAPFEGCADQIAKSVAGKKALFNLTGVGHWHCIEAANEVSGIVNGLIVGNFFSH